MKLTGMGMGAQSSNDTIETWVEEDTFILTQSRLSRVVTFTEKVKSKLKVHTHITLCIIVHDRLEMTLSDSESNEI
jgi:hypothetical protein